MCVIFTLMALSFAALMLDKTTSSVCKPRMLVLDVPKIPLWPPLPKLWVRMADTCATRKHKLRRQVVKPSLYEGPILWIVLVMQIALSHIQMRQKSRCLKKSPCLRIMEKKEDCNLRLDICKSCLPNK